jgi:outer membrane protein, heavy metal efflux system
MSYANMENWRCMMFNIKIFVLTVFLFPAIAQSQEVLSLSEIFKKIDSNNLLLKTYDIRAESYKYSAKAATAWMPPMVGAGSWQTPYSNKMVMDPRERGMLMFRIEQEIPNPSKQKASRRFIESQGNVESVTRDVTLNNLKAQAREQYYAWLIAVQKLKVLSKNEQVLSLMRKIEEVRYPYNQSQLSSIYRSDAAIEENRTMMQMQLGEIARAKGFINGLMNREGSKDFNIDTTHEVRFEPTLQIDTSMLAQNRKDVLRMNESIKSMQLNIESIKLHHKPDFRIQFDHMSPLNSMMPNAFSVMGMVTIPIAPWASKMYRADLKAMELNIRAMETERAAMLQETQGMLYGMQGEIQSMQKRISAIETKVLPALQKTFDANYLLYQENKLSITMLLDSYEALNMMRMDLLNEKQKLYQMIADYEKELYL